VKKEEGEGKKGGEEEVGELGKRKDTIQTT
jgi:hypothetical protein